MGCYSSKLDKEEMVSRCKARMKYTKQLVKARDFFSHAHIVYLRSLRSIGIALVQFANTEDKQQQQQHHLPPPLPSPPSSPPPSTPPPQSQVPITSVSDTWVSGWSIWDPLDPFGASSSRSETTEFWENTQTGSKSAVTPLNGYSKEEKTELAVVVLKKVKDLSEIAMELEEYFIKAADGGSHVSVLLEAVDSTVNDKKIKGKIFKYGVGLNPVLRSWRSRSKFSGFSKLRRESTEGDAINTSHCSSVVKLYTWEKKLYNEVKNAESIKIDHEKKAALLRKQEAKGGDYMKIEKSREEVDKLESRMLVTSQAIETISSEINTLRENELYPQLLELIKGLVGMWRTMYQCHQVQTHIVQQLKYLEPEDEPTTNVNRQATLLLEQEVQRWHTSFSNLVKSQRSYIHSLTGWLRLSLFQFNSSYIGKSPQNSVIYTLCEEWQCIMDRIPDKVASESIKNLSTTIHSIILQQSEERKQKKRYDIALKRYEKKAAELRSLENKYRPNSHSIEDSGSSIVTIRTKVETLKVKVEEERSRNEKSARETRAMTLSSLQTVLPNMFQALTGFSRVFIQGFESIQAQSKISDGGGLGAKKLLT